MTTLGYTRILLIAVLMISVSACTAKKTGAGKDSEPEIIYTNQGFEHPAIEIDFKKGPEHNHPIMAIWLEDTKGNYIETLYVAESIGNGIFGHGMNKEGKWEPGPIQRPAALPYWWHKYGFLPDPENRVPDAISGPTPEANFVLLTNTVGELPEQFNVLFEINQSWDWNEYWTNDKFPDDAEYKTSSQPALVYIAFVDRQKDQTEFSFQIAGHSHYSGTNGNLYTNTESLTTAKDIVSHIKLKIQK